MPSAWTQMWEVQQTQPLHDSARPNEMVAAEHPIASEADRRPALVRVVIEGHASTRLQTP